MKLTEIAQMQRELDDHILQKHNLTVSDTFRKRILSFLVELGELANETRCFKYWSLKPSSDKDVILDEYVDGVHFLVSLGNDLHVDFSELTFDRKQDGSDVTEMFLEVFKNASMFQDEMTILRFTELFQSYIDLCFALGFTYEDVVTGYIRKNKVNHERQETNY